MNGTERRLYYLRDMYTTVTSALMTPEEAARANRAIDFDVHPYTWDPAELLNVAEAQGGPPEPLPLLPRGVWLRRRLEAIESAIGRYAIARKPFPGPWCEEAELIRKELG